MFSVLEKAKRLLIEAELAPVQGNRFQPTGFPDIGAARYRLPDGTEMLLVESAQSVANRLEATIIDPANELISGLAGLPYIRVEMKGDSESHTNSLIEAHRLNSPFIIYDEKFRRDFQERAHYAKGRSLNWQRIAEAVLAYDPNALLHGAFLANLEDGRIKMSRALSGFIEARGVREAVSGGVKNNPFDPSGKLRVKGYDKDVYSNVPYQRVEYTAEKIVAYFNLDLGLLRSYALGEETFSMLVSLALYKIRRFLSGGARLRTACDLALRELKVTDPANFALPTEDQLLKGVQAGIRDCQKAKKFVDPAVTQIVSSVFWKGGGEDVSDADEPAGD